MRVYLAGPDVFLPDPHARGAALKAVCDACGLIGIFPLDPLAQEPQSWSALPEWRRIALRNEAHIRAADALIANLTPFRGPSADPGTVFELGFARALGRPVFGWSADRRAFTERTLALLGASARLDPARNGGQNGGQGGWRDADGMGIEAFGCVDNLMIDGAVANSGGEIAQTGGAAVSWSDLDAFRLCAAAAARLLRGQDPP